MKIDSLLLAVKEYTKELIVIFVILLILLLLEIFPNIPLAFNIMILSFILMVASSIEGIAFGRFIIGKTEKKLKEQKAIRGGKEYRPLEFCFFVFIFIATVFLTYAMSYRDYQSIQDVQYFMLYWSLTFFFYITALMMGVAHYGKGIHGWIK